MPEPLDLRDRLRQRRAVVGARRIPRAVGLHAVAGIQRVGLWRGLPGRHQLAELPEPLLEERRLVLAVQRRSALVALLAVLLGRGDVLDIVVGQPGDHRAAHAERPERGYERLLDARPDLLRR